MIKKLAEEIYNKWNMVTKFIDLSKFDLDRIERFKADIRSTTPQIRGRIVTSKNYLLPLSKGKNLNISNTPVAIVYDNNDFPIDVYPHLIGTYYIDVKQFMERVLQEGSREYFSHRGLLEDPVKKLLSDDPSLFEEGTQYLGSEVETQKGFIDILLNDKKGRIIIGEIETNAKETAVSQVCRLAIGYAEATQQPLTTLRKVIICINYDSAVVDASKGAGVEVFKVTLEKIV